MRFKTRFIILFLLILFAKADAAVFTLDDALKIALQNNPELKAAQLEWTAAQSKIPLEKSLPDPEIALESMELKNVSPMVSQTFPYPGKLSARGATAHHEAKRQEFLFKAVRLNLIKAVKERYFSLLYHDQRIRLYKEKKSLLKSLATVARSRYIASEKSSLDFIRAHIEDLKTENELKSLESVRVIEQGKLNRLLGRNLVVPIIPTASVTILKTEISVHPEIEAAKHHVLHVDFMKKAAREDYMPDLTVQFGMPMGGQAAQPFVGFKLSLPFLWSWKKGALIQSLNWEKEVAQAKLEQIKIQIEQMVQEYSVLSQNDLRQLQLYKTDLLPQSAQAVKVAQRQYEIRQLTFLELIAIVDSDVNLNLERAKIEYDSHVHQAYLDQAIGGDQ